MRPKLKVFPVSKNVRDVFWGYDGWEPHTRVHLAREVSPTGTKVVVSHMAGTKIPDPIKAWFLKTLRA